ncbi:MAG: Mini-ribonuclease 3 [Christensenellales bacterium]
MAFIGDGVHTLFVRESVMREKELTIKHYNKYCSTFCSAKTQSLVLDSIFNTLTEEEKDVVRRARNAKTNNVAKNSTIEEYKKATSFEALVGFLYLEKRQERLDEILKSSIQVLGEK